MAGERRRFARSVVKRDTFFVFNHFSTRVGHVRDISEGGVAFEYSHKIDTDFTPEVIDMFCLNNKDCYMASVQCKAVYAHFCDLPDREARAGYALCRCGLQFTNLSEVQKTQLKEIVSGRD